MPSSHTLPPTVIDALAHGLMHLIVHAPDAQIEASIHCQECSQEGLDLSGEIDLSVPCGQHEPTAEKEHQHHG